MTQAREPLSIMDGNPPTCDFSTKTNRGIYLSKSLAIVVCVIFASALVATSLIVYNFAACPHTDQLANVTKYELHHCEHESKLLVIPITTEHSKSVLPIDHTTPLPVDDEESTPTVTDVRLPRHTRPETYYLKLTPYILEGNFTFDGECSILFVVENATKQITFHGVELFYVSIKLFQESDGRAISILRRTEDEPRQFQQLSLAETLRTGQKYVLNITFKGILNDNLHGFYRSSYEEKNVTR